MRKTKNDDPKYLGFRSGRLEVIGFRKVNNTHMHGIGWDCRCDCGNVVYGKSPSAIKNGTLLSCGCLKKEEEKVNLGRKTHGLTNTRLYGIWNKMKDRCENPNAHAYSRYGGRGIVVCDGWHDFQTFYDWAMAHEYTDDLTLERVDVNGNYCPENCAWIPLSMQMKNRTDTVRVELDGRMMPLKEACETLGLPYKAVHLRMTRYGMSYEDAISKPFKDKSQSLKHRCEEAGLDYHLVYYRIKAGWSEERAMSEPVFQESELSRICKERGLDYHTIYARVHDYGWSVEKALNTPVVHGANQFTYKD